jgi:hypothetical protein
MKSISTWVAVLAGLGLAASLILVGLARRHPHASPAMSPVVTQLSLVRLPDRSFVITTQVHKPFLYDRLEWPRISP